VTETVGGGAGAGLGEVRVAEARVQQARRRRLSVYGEGTELGWTKEDDRQR